MKDIIVATFYKFVNLPDFKERREPLLEFSKSLDLRGSILLASEGINSTISGTRNNIDRFFSYLKNDPKFSDIEWKESINDFKPFGRMKVRLKTEIVRMGAGDIDVENHSGIYIEPKDWDNFINDPEVTLIDTRNDYEVRIGSFRNAINPKTNYFRQFPRWAEENLNLGKQKKIAMFCTGGIRCEKSTAYLREKGFDKVYHLKGGILKYLEETHNKNGMWQGSCFVFDDRVALDDEMEIDGSVLCDSCGAPVTTDALKLAPIGSKVICGGCNS